MNKENLTAYEVVTEEELTDIHSKGWLLRHKKTGARVMLIENDDENKVFNIAFRTPPKDSTGVAHILEKSPIDFAVPELIAMLNPIRLASKAVMTMLFRI